MWSQIAEEVRERRHDSNYDNLTKGLQGMPTPTLALPASSEKKQGKKSAKSSNIPTALPVGEVTSSSSTSKNPNMKTPCSLHAAGLCRFGDRCRHEHLGDPGSEKARNAFTKFQQDRGDSAKGKGKSKGKDKGKKASDDKNKDKKSSDTKAPATPGLAAAVAASTVTISDASKVAAWNSFFEFARRAMPSLQVFLRLSIPILASIISSVDMSQIGQEDMNAMLCPAFEQFQDLSLELLGDTGAATDLGSFGALESQGFSKEMIEPWLKSLDKPVKFSTGGGPQTSNDAVRLVPKEIGELNLHLLENCPLALSIGKQVSKGRTFIWQHGKMPFIALDHKKCRVWCPVEQRWYAKRVQHNIPIFSLNPQHVGKPQLCAPVQSFDPLWQPGFACCL